MDKKNTTIGVICVIAAFAALFLGQKFSPPPPATPPPVSTAVVKSVDAAIGTPTTPAGAPIPATSVAAPALNAIAKEPPAAAVTTLENDYITAHFTNYGGAIRDVALRKFPAELGHLIIRKKIPEAEHPSPDAGAGLDHSCDNAFFLQPISADQAGGSSSDNHYLRRHRSFRTRPECRRESCAGGRGDGRSQETTPIPARDFQPFDALRSSGSGLFQMRRQAQGPADFLKNR
jgi:hypothetical protein